MQAFLTFLYSKSGTETGNESNACDVISRAREIDTSQRNTNNIADYYLFKKFLVSDWLTANCEIVISTQWLTKSGFFTFILAK